MSLKLNTLNQVRRSIQSSRIKGVIKGTKLNERFRSNETVEKAEVEEKNLTFYILMKILLFYGQYFF